MGNPLAAMGLTLEEGKTIARGSNDSLTKWQQVIRNKNKCVNKLSD